MGIFNSIIKIFHFKKKDENGFFCEDDKEEINLKSYEDILDTNCDQVAEAAFQLEDLMPEYRLVISYLDDIKKIENIQGADREQMKSCAKSVVNFDEAYMHLCQTEGQISDIQYWKMKQFEGEIPGAISRIREAEEQQSVIREDRHQLEGETGALRYEREEDCEKQNGIRVGILSVGLMLIIVVGLFAVLSHMYEVSLKSEIILALIIGAVVLALLYLRFQNLEHSMNRNQKKYKRTNSLLNKMKMKYVNNENELSYLYCKYNVENEHELADQWERYQEIVETRRLRRKDTSQTGEESEELLKLLSKNKVKYPRNWVNQAIAIIDGEEMKKLKSSLHKREQKLKGQIEYNEGIRAQSFQEIQNILEKAPELKEYVDTALADYPIEL